MPWQAGIAKTEEPMSGQNNPFHPAYADYQAYLLRLWQETPRSSWRFWLQDPATGEGRLFADLESLQAFLQDRVTGPVHAEA